MSKELPQEAKAKIAELYNRYNSDMDEFDANIDKSLIQELFALNVPAILGILRLIANDALDRSMNKEAFIATSFFDGITKEEYPQSDVADFVNEVLVWMKDVVTGGSSSIYT